MKRVLAIDPGVVSGFALFEDGELACAWEEEHRNLLDVNIASELTRCYVLDSDQYSTVLDDVVIEYPQIYPIKNWKGDPNDLIQVGVIVGQYIANLVLKWIVYNIYQPKARAWKGQVPKFVMNKRTLEKLTPAERKRIIKKSEHVLDAIGIGLWHLKR